MSIDTRPRAHFVCARRAHYAGRINTLPCGCTRALTSAAHAADLRPVTADTRAQTHEGARAPTPPALFLTATKLLRGGSARPPPPAGGGRVRWRGRACRGRHKSPLPFSARGVLDARLGGRHLPLFSPLPGLVCTRTRGARRLSAVRHSPRVKTKPRPCLSKCEHVLAWSAGRVRALRSGESRRREATAAAACRARNAAGIRGGAFQIQLFASPVSGRSSTRSLGPGSTESSPACAQWVGVGASHLHAPAAAAALVPRRNGGGRSPPFESEHFSS